MARVPVAITALLNSAPVEFTIVISDRSWFTTPATVIGPAAWNATLELVPAAVPIIEVVAVIPVVVADPSVRFTLSAIIVSPTVMLLVFDAIKALPAFCTNSLEVICTLP